MILHVDLDAFYASVEQRDDPSLVGKPVLIGAPTGRSVVSAASYEARKFGCRSAMPMSEARRRCPQAIVIPPSMGKYARESKRFFRVLERYSPVVEPLSIDEAFIDVRGSEQLFGPPVEIARKIRADTKTELQLTCSIGVAPVKFAAKIASDLCKPDGLREVKAEELIAFLAPLPIERLFGVGPKTAERLHGLGLRTLDQIARYPTDALVRKLGDEGPALQALACGIDPRQVIPDRAAKSIGAEDTFETDLVDGPELRRAVMAQADRVAERLRAHALVCNTVVLKLKDTAFQSRTRQRGLSAASSDGRVITQVALQLLEEAHVGAPGVRLSGVAVHGLEREEAPRQLALEPRAGKGDKLMKALDAIKGKYGRSAIDRAELIGEDRESRRAQRRGDAHGGDYADED